MIATLKNNPMLQEQALSLLWRLPAGVRRGLYRTLTPVAHRRFQEMRHADTALGRSLAPFDEHRCIFVHIPKCAGMSITRSLFGNLAGGHLRIAHYQLIFGERQLDEYFKFAFVRNPWDRLVSAFRFLKRGGHNAQDRAWAREHLGRFDDFHAFVTGWVSRKNVSGWKHFAPQHKFVCEPGQETPSMDFIGYFEHLADDFERVRARLGIRAELEHCNRSRGGRPDYRSYYTPETRDLVGEVYAEDLRIFGYGFETACPRRRAELSVATAA